MLGNIATIKRGHIVSENGTATGILPGNLIRGKQISEVKSEISKVSLFDRTFRLFFLKIFKIYWSLSKKKIKTTIA